MKKRESKVFGILEETPKTELRIITKAPEKWILIDTESMQVYQGSKESKEVGKMWRFLKCRFELVLDNE